MNLILLSKKLRFIFFLRSFSFTSLFMTVLLRITEFVNVTFLNDCPLFPQIYKPMIPNATRIYRTKTRDTFGIIKLLSFVITLFYWEREGEREREKVANWKSAMTLISTVALSYDRSLVFSADRIDKFSYRVSGFPYYGADTILASWTSSDISLALQAEIKFQLEILWRMP